MSASEASTLLAVGSTRGLGLSSWRLTIATGEHEEQFIVISVRQQ